MHALPSERATRGKPTGTDPHQGAKHLTEIHLLVLF